MEAQLIWNTDDEEHEKILRKLFRQAVRLECAVAFLKSSGLNRLRTPLLAFLKRGGVARFVVGLDFALTDPDALQQLLDWTNKFNLTLYCIDNGGSCTFHPKVYQFETAAKRRSALVGSANLTAGGLGDNYECSVLLPCKEQDISPLLTSTLEALKATPFKKADLAQYRKKHAIARRARDRQSAIIEELTAEQTQNDLAKELVLFRADSSNLGYAAQAKWRARSARDARRAMRLIASQPSSPSALYKRMASLSSCFHSRIPMFYAPSISRRPQAFRKLVQAALNAASLSPSDAYRALEANAVPGVGPNWLTEMLHAVNPRRFAVLNANSNDGLRSVRPKLPKSTGRKSVTPERYEVFCIAARDVANELGLPDLGQLDALLSRLFFSKQAASR
ncbi:MAG TPA: phospholipase D family protein [Vitreimonas sp.]|uniref:phospholipase D family protein n=1 Tax=Vitreimonas sp. TaxID=3069702 RepID=UPI002D506484|nr:phospholipase D family protein [Vitreimonas sp.]HYD86255.1 phospholipase D family protein [Vitreimonas sp.]